MPNRSSELLELELGVLVSRQRDVLTTLQPHDDVSSALLLGDPLVALLETSRSLLLGSQLPSLDLLLLLVREPGNDAEESGNHHAGNAETDDLTLGHLHGLVDHDLRVLLLVLVVLSHFNAPC